MFCLVHQTKAINLIASSQDLKKKHQLTLEAQAEIARANVEAEEMKKRKEEQERLADLKVNEYMKQKAAREAAFEAEQEKIKIEKEKEIARLRAQQVCDRAWNVKKVLGSSMINWHIA